MLPKKPTYRRTESLMLLALVLVGALAWVGFPKDPSKRRGKITTDAGRQVLADRTVRIPASAWHTFDFQVFKRVRVKVAITGNDGGLDVYCLTHDEFEEFDKSGELPSPALFTDIPEFRMAGVRSDRREASLPPGRYSIVVHYPRRGPEGRENNEVRVELITQP